MKLQERNFQSKIYKVTIKFKEYSNVTILKHFTLIHARYFQKISLNIY